MAGEAPCVPDQHREEIGEIVEGEAGEVELGLQQVAVAQRAQEARAQPDVPFALLDHPVRRQQVEQEPQARLIGAERPAERIHGSAAALHQAVDQPELEGGLEGPRADDGPEELVDDQELEVLRAGFPAFISDLRRTLQSACPAAGAGSSR